MAKEKDKEKDNDKLKNFESIIKELEKDYGKGSVMSFGQKSTGSYEIISTGSLGFDISTGIGGFALGRMYELMGWEGSNKTTICGHLSANAQKNYPNRKVVYIDSEHALDRGYFAALGVDVDKLWISQPSNAEEGFQIARRLIESGEVSLCIIDSDTSLKPRSEVEGEIGDSAIGKKARLNSQAYPLLHNAISTNNTCMVVVSQFREKIGVMFGSPVTTTGGNALRFYSDVRIEISKSLLKEDDVTYGNKTKIKITKNKMAPPFRNCEFEVLFGKGIDKDGEILNLAIDNEIISKWGKIITYKETKYDISEFGKLISDNQEFREELEQKIKDKLDGKN